MRELLLLLMSKRYLSLVFGEDIMCTSLETSFETLVRYSMATPFVMFVVSSLCDLICQDNNDSNGNVLNGQWASQWMDIGHADKPTNQRTDQKTLQKLLLRWPRLPKSMVLGKTVLITPGTLLYYDRCSLSPCAWVQNQRGPSEKCRHIRDKLYRRGQHLLFNIDMYFVIAWAKNRRRENISRYICRSYTLMDRR